MPLRKITVPLVGGGTQALLVDQSASAAPTDASASGSPVQATYPLTPTVLTGNQSLTVSTTAVSLTVPSGATHAFASVEGGDVRVWEDGTNPTATTGVLLLVGTIVEFDNLANIRLIRAGSVDATVQLSYRKYV